MIFRQRELFDKAHWQGTLNDVRDFMEMPHMRSHWAAYGQFYSANFREFMEKDVLLEKMEQKKKKKKDRAGKAETSRPEPEVSLRAAQSSET